MQPFHVRSAFYFHKSETDTDNIKVHIDSLANLSFIEITNTSMPFRSTLAIHFTDREELRKFINTLKSKIGE